MYIKTLLSSLAVTAVFACCATPVLANHQFRGRLTCSDPCGYRSNCYYDSHRVYLQCGCNYVITLNSCDFDSYLFLIDSCGRRVACDDDGGSGLNSRICFRPRRSGWYRVIATSYRRDTGSYCLRVRR